MVAPPPAGTLRPDILAALENAATAFDPDELAYLALTSKPELQVKDKLAWQLTKAGYHAAREWRRCDLAILGGNERLALVELKAAHTGDVEWAAPTAGGERADLARKYCAATYFEGLIRCNAEKARKLAPAAEACVLVVINHVADPVPPQLGAVGVKYGRQLRRVADEREAQRIIADT